jgi:hypothetical protein
MSRGPSSVCIYASGGYSQDAVLNRARILVLRSHLLIMVLSGFELNAICDLSEAISEVGRRAGSAYLARRGPVGRAGAQGQPA